MRAPSKSVFAPLQNSPPSHPPLVIFSSRFSASRVSPSVGASKMLLSRILSCASRSTSRTASFLSSPPQALHAPLVSDQCRALAYGSPGKVVPPNQFIFHATPFRQYGISPSASPEHTERVSNSKGTKASGNAENSNQSGDGSAGESKVSSETESDDEDSKRKFIEWVESYLKEEGYKEKTRDVKSGYVVYERDPLPGEQLINDEDFKKGLDIFLEEKEKRTFSKGKTLLGFMTNKGVPRPGEVGATHEAENDAATEANTAEEDS